MVSTSTLSMPREESMESTVVMLTMTSFSRSLMPLTSRPASPSSNGTVPTESETATGITSTGERCWPKRLEFTLRSSAALEGIGSTQSSFPPTLAGLKLAAALLLRTTFSWQAPPAPRLPALRSSSVTASFHLSGSPSIPQRPSHFTASAPVLQPTSMKTLSAPGSAASISRTQGAWKQFDITPGNGRRFKLSLECLCNNDGAFTRSAHVSEAETGTTANIMALTTRAIAGASWW
mmetsp:Transcript_34645/g.98971  ORF Transcript_34645/g.98971 Transcript_34645/m.98971 type:complete len:235 (+) Transcript_34645:307-1011(+)